MLGHPESGVLQQQQTRRDGLSRRARDSNYWTYAHDFTLDDHMFEPEASWSLPDHLYMVSAWSALCTTPAASSCKNDIVGPYSPSNSSDS